MNFCSREAANGLLDRTVQNDTLSMSEGEATHHPMRRCSPRPVENYRRRAITNRIPHS